MLACKYERHAISQLSSRVGTLLRLPFSGWFSTPVLRDIREQWSRLNLKRSFVFFLWGAIEQKKNHPSKNEQRVKILENFQDPNKNICIPSMKSTSLLYVPSTQILHTKYTLTSCIWTRYVNQQKRAQRVGLVHLGNKSCRFVEAKFEAKLGNGDRKTIDWTRMLVLQFSC